MVLGLLVLALVGGVLAAPVVARGLTDLRRRATARRVGASELRDDLRYDPGRERRAEQRARQLLRSCVNDEEWAMYRDLGFLRVHGRAAGRAIGASGAFDGTSGAFDGAASDLRTSDAPASDAPASDAHHLGGGQAGNRAVRAGDGYAYLVYAHKPIVAFVPATGQLLSEYCVEFPDLHGDGRTRLPASDDVLAKWMALTSDENRVIGTANMHLVGRQHDPARLRRDLWRLGEWDRRRGAQDDQVQSRR